MSAFDIVKLIRTETCSCGGCEPPVTETDCGFYKIETYDTKDGVRFSPAVTRYVKLPESKQNPELHPYARTVRQSGQSTCKGHTSSTGNISRVSTKAEMREVYQAINAVKGRKTQRVIDNLNSELKPVNKAGKSKKREKKPVRVLTIADF